MRKTSLKNYVLFVLLTEAVGALSGLISRGGMNSYNNVAKSSLTPPTILFPIVWAVLFLLLGIGAARIYSSDSYKKEFALTVFALQLAVNFLWSPFFFNLRAYGFAFFWLILLWLLIIAMIVIFYKIDKLAALIQIPYLLWVTFAAYLNLTTWLLNK